jgi:hypothetical protein
MINSPFDFSNFSDNSSPIHGLVDGIEYRQHERLDELNQRISSRIYADSPLRPHFNPRPVLTKYSKFPIIDRRNEPNIKIQNYLDYNIGSASIVGSAPIEGFQNNVSVESDLRNQFYALSSAPQRHYVPSSTSDLYIVPEVSGSINEEQPFPGLFDFTMSIGIHPIIDERPDIGSNVFFNSTRCQLRGGGDFAR